MLPPLHVLRELIGPGDEVGASRTSSVAETTRTPMGPHPTFRALRRGSSPPEEKPLVRPRHTTSDFTPMRYRFTRQPRVVMETRVVEVPIVQLEEPVVTLLDSDEEAEGAQEGGQTSAYTPSTPSEDPLEEDELEASRTS